MSGFHITIDIFLRNICYHLTNSIFPYYLWCRLSRQYQHFLAVAIDVQLSGANHRGQFRVVLQGLPKSMIFAVLVEELLLQVRAHIGGVDGHLVNRSMMSAYCGNCCKRASLCPSSKFSKLKAGATAQPTKQKPFFEGISAANHCSGRMTTCISPSGERL